MVLADWLYVSRLLLQILFTHGCNGNCDVSPYFICLSSIGQSSILPDSLFVVYLPLIGQLPCVLTHGFLVIQRIVHPQTPLSWSSCPLLPVNYALLVFPVFQPTIVTASNALLVTLISCASTHDLYFTVVCYHPHIYPCCYHPHIYPCCYHPRIYRC